MSTPSLNGITVVGFESRMSETTADLIEKYGGKALPAPSLQEVPLEEHGAVFDFAERLFDGAFDLVYFTTGVGTELVFETLSKTYEVEELRAALAEVVVVVRSPKPGRELKARDVSIDLKVPEPHSSEEALDTLVSHADTAPLDSKRIAVHEYGRPNEELNGALRRQGAEVVSVPIYRWELPDDIQPLKNGIRALIGGWAQAALFTSRQQVTHVLQVAADHGWERALRTALSDAMVASVGTVTTRALEENGIAVDYEPERPKLAILIKGMAEFASTYFQPA